MDDDIFLEWIRPVHLDDESQQPEPRVASQARSEGINVQRVLSEEVGLTSSDDDLDGHDCHGGGDGGGGGVGVGSGSGGCGYGGVVVVFRMILGLWNRDTKLHKMRTTEHAIHLKGTTIL